MKMMSLKRLHRRLFVEAYGAWDRLEASDVKEMKIEDLKEMLTTAKDHLNKTGDRVEVGESLAIYKETPEFKSLSEPVGWRVESILYSLIYYSDVSSELNSLWDLRVQKPELLASTINAIQEALEIFETLRKSRETNTREMMAKEIADMFRALSEEESKAVYDRMYDEGAAAWVYDVSFDNADKLEKGLNREFKSMMYSSCVRSVTLVRQYIDELRERIRTAKTGVLGEREQQQVDLIVQMLRFYGEFPESGISADVAQSIPYNKNDDQRREEILSLPRTDPEIGPQSIEKIKEFVIQRYVRSSPIHLAELMATVKRLNSMKGLMKLLHDKEFQMFLDDLWTQAKRVVKLEKWTDVRADIADMSGAEGNDLVRIMRDIKNGGQGAYNAAKAKDATEISAYLPSLRDDGWVRAWNSSNPEKRRDIVKKIKDIVDAAEEQDRERREKLRKKNPPEAPENADFRPFDDYVFAPQREDQVPEEDNNSDEGQLYISLRDHFVANEPTSAEQAELISKVLEKGYYKDIFREPEQEWVYRGISASDEWLRKLLELGPNDPLPEKASKKGSFKLSPRRPGKGTTSWSISSKSALNFGRSSDDHQLLLVASTKLNKNKFAVGPGGLYKVKKYDTYEEELEAVGLGEIEVSKIYWRKSYDGAAIQVREPKESNADKQEE